MICPSCAEGDHCNDSGCTCGHRPRAPRRALTDPLVPLGPEPVRPDLSVPAVPPASDTPLFVTLLADWAREHRAGRFGPAAAIRRRLTDLMDRLGPYS
jgi:hypothetical protein